jgi:hypothetical protein
VNNEFIFDENNLIRGALAAIILAKAKEKEGK